MMARRPNVHNGDDYMMAMGVIIIVCVIAIIGLIGFFIWRAWI